jgi:CheY-like chemotaxis protein/HPt (histidine-containing phosphotransfer) domain-containing protein
MQRPIIEHKVTQKMQFDRGLGQRHPLRLLVAEDNVVNQKVILHLLERLGYRADIATNGLEALDALRRQPYDVILMDGQMPEMDGEETTIVIRREWPIDRQPHIIAITANALQGDRERSFYIGMDDYISKPIRIEELTRALSRSEPLSDQENQPGSEQTFKKVIEPPVSETTPASPAVEVNIQPLAQASIDFSYLREFQSMMGEDAVQIVKELVNLYLNNSDTLINEMRQGIASQNTDLLRRAAHTLKGNSSQVGALKLAALSDELEMVAKAGSVEGAESMLEKINLEFNNVKIDLEARFAT